MAALGKYQLLPAAFQGGQQQRQQTTIARQQLLLYGFYIAVIPAAIKAAGCVRVQHTPQLPQTSTTTPTSQHDRSLFPFSLHLSLSLSSSFKSWHAGILVLCVRTSRTACVCVCVGSAVDDRRERMNERSQQQTEIKNHRRMEWKEMNDRERETREGGWKKELKGIKRERER